MDIDIYGDFMNRNIKKENIIGFTKVPNRLMKYYNAFVSTILTKWNEEDEELYYFETKPNKYKKMFVGYYHENISREDYNIHADKPYNNSNSYRDPLFKQIFKLPESAINFLKNIGPDWINFINFLFNTNKSIEDWDEIKLALQINHLYNHQFPSHIDTDLYQNEINIMQLKKNKYIHFGVYYKKKNIKLLHNLNVYMKPSNVLKLQGLTRTKLRHAITNFQPNQKSCVFRIVGDSQVTKT